MALSADSARLGATTDRTLNKLAFAIANKANDITTATTSDRVLMVDASADYEVKYADGDNVLEMAGITATATEINAAADAGQRLVKVTDGAAFTVLAADSGKTHVIPNLTADIVITLPTAVNGLNYRFIYGGVAADAQDWALDTAAAGAFYLGGVVYLDTGAGAAGDEVVPVFPNGTTNAILNVLVPQGGTWVDLICDGTNWFVNGQVVGATAPTFADT